MTRRTVTFGGRTQTVGEWAREIGVATVIIRHPPCGRGLPLDEVLRAPTARLTRDGLSDGDTIATTRKR